MKKPVRISIMDLDEFITSRNVREVTSPFIKETSTGNFDQAGLFSEQIFGEIGSPDRISTHGYLELNTTLFHAEIYDILKRMKSYYEDILRGTVYARFDNTVGEFIKTESDDPKADTGYSFFMQNAHKIKWGEADSEMRKTRIKILKANKKKWTLTRCLILPAGLRDYREKDGRGEYDEINKIYRRVIEVSSTLKDSDTDNPLFDTIRFNLQRCISEIDGYIWDMVSDDSGFIQDKYGSRSVTRATRNVLVATDVSSDEDNPESKLKPDEVLVPLYQAMVALMPLFKYSLSTIFFNSIFSISSDQAGLIDPKTYQLSYVELDVEERGKYLASDKMEAMLMTFRDESLRHMPVVVMGTDRKPYYLYLIYVKDGKSYIGRSFSDMKTLLEEQGVVSELKQEDLRPITYFEMYYHACYVAAKGKHMTVTRYPVTHHWSIFPARMHIASTMEFEKKNLHVASGSEGFATLPRWPTQGGSSVNGMSVHPAQLKINLGGDHDGDMVNGIAIMSDEANQECAEYLRHPKFIVDPNGQPMLGMSSDLCKLTMFNITRKAKTT